VKRDRESTLSFTNAKDYQLRKKPPHAKKYVTRLLKGNYKTNERKRKEITGEMSMST
jgi:hypothetical protein